MAETQPKQEGFAVSEKQSDTDSEKRRVLEKMALLAMSQHELVSLCFQRGAELAAAQAKAEADRVDAERYRWLRDNPNGVSYCDEHEGNIGASIWLNGAELDAAIDAARQK